MDKIHKKQQISALKEWDNVDDVFVVKIKRGIAPYAKGYTFQLLLSDNSGKTIDYKYWGGNDESKVKGIYDSIKGDSVIHVKGKVSTYNGKLQLATNEPDIIKVLNEDQYHAEDFVKPARKDIEEMYSSLKSYIKRVSNNQIKQLLKNIFENPEIAAKFKTHPAAIEIHHNWISGLLEHVLEMLKICDTLKEIYPVLNRDLMITGVLLHDIGKLEELQVTSRIKGTLGQMTGHIVIGSSFVLKEIEKIGGFDENLKQKIIHLIVSHHGKNEYGSPKEPMFLEAVVLNYVDELSSKITELSEFINNAKEETEDDFMFNKRHGRNIFLR